MGTPTIASTRRNLFDCLKDATDMNISRLSVGFQANYSEAAGVYACSLSVSGPVDAPSFHRAPWVRHAIGQRSSKSALLHVGALELYVQDLPEHLAREASDMCANLTDMLDRSIGFTYALEQPRIFNMRYICSDANKSQIIYVERPE